MPYVRVPRPHTSVLFTKKQPPANVFILNTNAKPPKGRAMKRRLLMGAVCAMVCWNSFAANEIGYIETYSLSEDRTEALKQLIPGTRDYYYYHCLHFQNTGNTAKLGEFMKQYIKRHGYTGRVKELRNRQALLDYRKNPKGALSHIRNELGLHFNHRRRIDNQKSSAPTKLNPKTISYESFKTRAMRNHKNLHGFDDAALEALVGTKLTDVQRRDLLHRLRRPDVPGLVDEIVTDLKAKDSRGFGHHPVHAMLLRKQVDELLKKMPDLKNSSRFVSAYLTKLRPNDDLDLERNHAARRAYLQRLWDYAQTLDPVHNSLKANVLYGLLAHDRAQGKYDPAAFMTYIRLPRNVPYINRKYYDSQSSRHRANLGQRFNEITLPPVGNEEPLVMDFLAELLADADDYKIYLPYMREEILKRAMAETKILNGIGNPERWASMLTPSEYKALKDRVELDFVPRNRTYFGPDDPVSLTLRVKNVSGMIVKVFEINTANYYREKKREIDLAVNLDGLVATFEERKTYSDPPLRRQERTFEFPQLKKRGVYVVEFIGNGKSSRALIQKGRLQFVSRTMPAGQAFTVLDEANRPVKDARLWIAGREYAPEEDGEIVVPFSTNPRRESVIIRQGDFATHATFNHEAEQYALKAGFYVDREALLKRKQAELLVRPVLQLNGTPISVELLEEVRLVVESVDRDGVSSRKEVPDFKLSVREESTYSIKVPENLSQIAFTLTAKIRNISRNKKEDLAASRRFQLNAMDKGLGVDDVHVTHADGNYVVELLGKNGETKVSQPIYAEFKHRLFRETMHVSLRTDEKGRTYLGALDDIDWIRIKGPNDPKHLWHTPRADCALPNELHGVAGHESQLPFVWKAQARRAQVSLLAKAGGTYTHDVADAVSIENGTLTIGKLPAGDYDLWIKPANHRVTLRVTDGARTRGHILSNTRYLETPKLKPLGIQSVDARGDELLVRLNNANPYTRVHVVAARYLPQYALFPSLGDSGMPGPSRKRRTDPTSLYESGRSIGDEYRYILDRQYAKKYPGNMLKRPGLLLNPWAIRKTETEQEELALRGSYGGGKGRGTDAARRGRRASAAAASRDAYANLDFLKDTSAVLANLKPDDQGVVRIPKQKLGPHAHVRILAVDPESAILRHVSLPDVPLATSEQRLVLGFDPGKRFTEQKLIAAVKQGESITIEDVTTAKMESYDTLSDLFKLYATLSGNGMLNEFGFIREWPTFDADKKQERYSRYACHELSFFLHQRDPAFFKAVVLPYLRNKKDKTFMDHWLIGADLKMYLEPWAFGRLNIVERILLGRQIRERKPHLARFVKDLADMIPPDIAEYTRRFNTAIQSSALEGGGEFDKLAERVTALARDDGATALGALRLAARPSPAAPAKPGLAITGEAAMPERARATSKAKRVSESLRKLKTRSSILAAVEEEAEVLEEVTAEIADLGGDMFFDKAVADRKRARRHFQKLDKTEELVENNYYHLPVEQQVAGLITVNDFWSDYAAHDGKTPFLSKHLAQPTGNFAEMMFALSVVDLPFESQKHETKAEGAGYTMKAASPIVVFHQEILESEAAADKTPILVSQHFFRADDRYRHENNERFEKYVTEEFLRHVVYGCQVILTNPNANRQKLSLLLQIPKGAIPVNSGFYTRGRQVTLEPYATQTMEYYFYFPEAGNYMHYPVHVAKNEKLVARAAAFVFNVVEKLSRIDKTSWAYVSQNGTEDQVIAFLETHNLNRLKLAEIAWRMKDKAFFTRTIDLLSGRHHYDGTLWSYGISHNVLPVAREFLRHSAYANRVGMFIDTPLLTVNPVARHRYQHMEYAPLVNPRAHQVGKERTILNRRFREQYQRLMTVLSYKAALDDADELAVAYYMLLQNRVEEGLDWFARVDIKQLPTRLQYDYMNAYVQLYNDKPDRALALAQTYKDYPVPRWRSKFVNLLNQLEEAKGEAPTVADTEDRDQAQSQLAATEPSLTFEVEARTIRIEYQNLDTCVVNYYPMDIELLFSRNPFIQEQSAQFSLIRPVMSRELKLPEGKTRLELKLPDEFETRNVMVEIVAAGIRRAQAYYANAMAVQTIENYGQVRVTHEETRKPLSKVYVKVYAKMRDGRVKFFKDGYTDFRGRFDYVSLNTNELDNATRLSLLILSEDHGAVIREVQPPKR